MIFNKNNFSILSPSIMGICNVTKDSFSDAGKNYKTSNALKSIKQMIKDGAQIIDIGAESTRPGSDPISYQQEIRKLSPILKKLPKDGSTLFGPYTDVRYLRKTLKVIHKTFPLRTCNFFINDNNLNFYRNLVVIIFSIYVFIIILLGYFVESKKKK